MSNRIYGTRTDINEQEVRDFYNKRAALASSMKNPLSAVVNGEQNPEQADTRSRFDREYIVPRLDLTQNSAVLDIGCGMGRFADCRTGIFSAGDKRHQIQRQRPLVCNT